MEVIKIEISQKRRNYDQYIDNKANIYYDIFRREDIAKFTYYDYLYIEEQKKRQSNSVEESKEKYETISFNSIHNVHDRTY